MGEAPGRVPMCPDILAGPRYIPPAPTKPLPDSGRFSDGHYGHYRLYRINAETTRAMPNRLMTNPANRLMRVSRAGVRIAVTQVVKYGFCIPAFFGQEAQTAGL